MVVWYAIEVASEPPLMFDLRSLPDDFYDNPYPYYRELRLSDPAHQLPDGSYFLTRYADLVQVYRDPKSFSSDKRVEYFPKFGDSPLYQHHTTSLVFNDPPLHSRVRRLIVGALSPKALTEMENPLIQLVDRLLDGIEKRGRADLVNDFAAAIPVEVIGNLLGVPRPDRQPLRGWSLAILSALEPNPSSEILRSGNLAVSEFLDYLRTLVSERRLHPLDPEKDVLTRLIQGEPGGEQLTESELFHNCIFILNAGHETTTNLIANGLQLLLDWPDQQHLLRSSLELIPIAIEEFLRIESSNQLGNRMATRPVNVGGVTLAGGTQIHLCIGAANRDPEQFPEPDRLDVRRSPNRHLAFALGPHQCAGMHVARMEAKIAISRFLARFRNYSPAGPARRSKRARFRGYISIPVEVGVA
jgi:cytochrome P450